MALENQENLNLPLPILGPTAESKVYRKILITLLAVSGSGEIHP